MIARPRASVMVHSMGHVVDHRTAVRVVLGLNLANLAAHVRIQVINVALVICRSWRNRNPIIGARHKVIPNIHPPVLVWVMKRILMLLRLGHEMVLSHRHLVNRRLRGVSGSLIHLILVNIYQLLLYVGIVGLVSIFKLFNVVKDIFDF